MEIITLIDLLEQIPIKKRRRILMRYLIKKYDSSKVMIMVEHMIKGNFSGLTIDEINDLIDIIKAVNPEPEPEPENQYESGYDTTNTSEVRDTQYSITIEDLMLENNNLRNEIRELKRMVNLTEKKELEIVDNNAINELYRNIINGLPIEDNGSAFLVRHEGKLIIPKAYYVITIK